MEPERSPFLIHKVMVPTVIKFNAGLLLAAGQSILPLGLPSNKNSLLPLPQGVGTVKPLLL